MAIVGEAAAIIAIGRAAVSAAKSLYEMIDSFQCLPKLKQKLQELVKELVKELEVAEPHFDAAGADHTRRELDELKAMFKRLGAPSRIKLVVKYDAKLKEAERKLESLITHVTLQLRLPRVYNDTAEGPISQVGIDRSKSILEFLQQTSQQEALRVICISGQAGVGKTTLLDHIWKEVSLKEPFLARAYVRVGENPSETNLCDSQSYILEQLGAGRLKFLTPEFGRGGTVEHFKRLRSNNRPVILAIDNVWDVQDLQKLLPNRMTSDLLPSSSCIMLTCRDARVRKALLNICDLNVEENHLQVFLFTPKCLSREESLRMFAETANMDADAHQELLQEVVPLCGDLPLALTVLASIFRDKARRERKEWKRIVEGMTSESGQYDEGTSQVMKSLQLSFDRLSPTHKAAFLDVATVYYQWSWQDVERVVDAKVLEDLKDSSLLSQSDGYIRTTDFFLAAALDNWSKFGIIERRKRRHVVILMHDLTLKFARRLVGSQLDLAGARSANNFDTMASLISSLNPMDVRYLKVRMPLSAAADQEVNSVLLQFLARAKNLQTLILITGSQPEIEGFFCDAVHDGNLGTPRGRQLRYLVLDGWKNSSLLLQTMRPLMSGIRQIKLENCDDLRELPSIPLGQLERLKITGCHNLQSFSKQCVEGWHNLKELLVFHCGNIREVPDELGRLPELQEVQFSDCKNLEKFASLCNPNGPVDLMLNRCGRLQNLPLISCQLGAFFIWNTPITSLINVDENAWKSVSVLELEGCEFEVLPESICRATAVQVISLDRCKKLRELPDGIEGLQSLKRLSLADCYALERLPDEIGRLTSLIKLDVSGCTNLRSLPSTIGSCLSLQELKCDKLVELPDEIRNLTSLIVLV